MVNHDDPKKKVTLGEIKDFVEKSKINLNAPTLRTNLISLAISSYREDIAKYLLDKGANPKISGNFSQLIKGCFIIMGSASL